MRRINQGQAVNSLQVLHLGEVPAGNFKTGLYFLIKNITDENVKVNVKLAADDEFISTVFYPGWNVEVVKEIQDAPLNTLQYGY